MYNKISVPPGYLSPFLQAVRSRLYQLSEKDFDPIWLSMELSALGISESVVLLRRDSWGRLEFRFAGHSLVDRFPELSCRHLPLIDLDRTAFVKWVSDYAAVAALGMTIHGEGWFSLYGKDARLQGFFLPAGLVSGGVADRVLGVIDYPDGPPT
ncbi:hypothetical protein K8Q93_01290 [Candidatus Parcubacteria bacterium]|nr:hypothetical protein [Candidatus Parcubacteria bacterium]